MSSNRQTKQRRKGTPDSGPRRNVWTGSPSTPDPSPALNPNRLPNGPPPPQQPKPTGSFPPLNQQNGARPQETVRTLQSLLDLIGTTVAVSTETASTNIDAWASGPADSKAANGDSFKTDTDTNANPGLRRQRELIARVSDNPDPAPGATSGTRGDEAASKFTEHAKPNPFLGIPITKPTVVDIQGEFNPFKCGEVVEASTIVTRWPYCGTRYSHNLVVQRPTAQQHSPHHTPPVPLPVPPPSYGRDPVQQQAQSHSFVHAHPLYYPGQPVMPGMAPPPPGMYMPSPYMYPMHYPHTPPNALHPFPGMGQMPLPGPYFPPSAQKASVIEDAPIGSPTRKRSISCPHVTQECIWCHPVVTPPTTSSSLSLGNRLVPDRTWRGKRGGPGTNPNLGTKPG